MLAWKPYTLGNPAASNLSNSGTYLGDHWVDLETSHHSSWLVTARSQVQALTCMVSSFLNVLSFFVKQPVALIPQIEINHLSVQKADTRIALIHLSGIFWFFHDFFFFCYICVSVCTYMHECSSSRILLFWARSLILRCSEVGVKKNGNQLSKTEARRDMCHWWGSRHQKL